MASSMATQMQAPRRADQAARLAFWLILGAALLDMIDFGILQVALPAIGGQFHEGLERTQWVIGAYGITLASFLMISGRAGDKYGHRRVFLAGLIVLGVASVAAALALNLTFLIAARLVQGVGGAMSSVAALAIFVRLFLDEHERNRYFGIFMAATAIGFALGNVLGGVLTDLLGWRSVLLVNAPVALVIVVLGQKFIRIKEQTGSEVRLDVVGGLVLTLALITLMYALTNAATYGFAAGATLVPLAASVALALGFAWVESSVSSPLIPMSFWKNRDVVVANGLCLLFGATAGASVLLTVHFQNDLGYSSTAAGFAILPVPASVFVGGVVLSARVLRALGPSRTLFASLTVNLVGALILTQYARGWLWLAPGMVMFGLGASFEFGAINAIALGNARPGEEGLAAGVVNTSFRVGVPLGVAVLVLIARLASRSRLEDGIQAALMAMVALIAVGIVLALTILPPMASTSGAPNAAQEVE